MTLQEMQQTKTATEETVRAALQKFANDTGLQIDDVRLEFVDYRGLGDSPRRALMSVTLVVRL